MGIQGGGRFVLENDLCFGVIRQLSTVGNYFQGWTDNEVCDNASFDGRLM